MNNWKKIIVSVLCFTACTTNEIKKVPTNTEKIFKIENLLFFGKAIHTYNFYANNNFKTVWQDSTNRSQLISAVIDSRFDGVLPEKYPISKLLKAHRNYNYLTIEQLKNADLNFTEVYFKLAKQLTLGKINPKKLHGDWEPYQPTINYDLLLKEALAQGSVYQTIENMKPSSEMYLKYKNAFAKYVPIKNFDTLTHEGLLQKKIWVNFERSKWLQPNLGKNYVWINLPTFKLEVVENNSVIYSHNVIIGKKTRKTPILSSAFNGIIINPTWTVPPTILKNDLVPKATANLGYFASNRLTIYNKKTGKQVTPSEWSAANYQSYRYVQKTGRLNALGQIKFDFPNKHMVYLHDTNNRTQFNDSNRALSSGCVRVHDPFRLAESIFKIEEKNITKADIDTLALKEKTKKINLNKKVNVHQVYFTAVITDSGKIQILNDVYSLDNVLYKKLIQ